MRQPYRPARRIPLLLIITLVAISAYLLYYRHTKQLRQSSSLGAITNTALVPVADDPEISLGNRPHSALPTLVPIKQTGIPRGRILMYHYVGTPPDPKKDPLGFWLTVTPDQLAKQLAYLKQSGYKPATLSDMLAGKTAANAVALTFDDGYEDFYTDAYPVLKSSAWPATAYIISGMIGGHYMTWDQIRFLDQHGITIGAHTIHHPDLATLTVAQQQTEIFGSKKTIEQEIGHPVIDFCYPSGKYTIDTERLVQAAGLRSATTTTSGVVTSTSDPYALPRYRILPTTDITKLLTPLRPSTIHG